MATVPITFANPEVLEFYKELPFNYHESIQIQAASIRRKNPILGYPVLLPLLPPGLRVLEVGCGAGWLSLALSLHHRCDVHAIDFNPTAVDRAQKMATLMRQPVSFETADLFLYEPHTPADLVISIGVLHHTNNCHAAIERLCTRFVRPGGHVFIGLYHSRGRRPFLNHFAALRDSGATEDQLFAEYRRLHASLKDETFARSWFRDQVLHPHETQHSLVELVPLFERCGMSLVATSVNGFAPFDSAESLFEIESRLDEAGERALTAGTYYPGFFLVLAQKIDGDTRTN